MNFEILLATNNKHKLQEVREILSPHGIIVYGISTTSSEEVLEYLSVRICCVACLSDTECECARILWVDGDSAQMH